MRRLLVSLFMVTLDIITIATAAFVAVFLRFDGNVPLKYLNYTVVSLPVLIAISVAVFYFFKLYNRIWRYASIREFLLIIGAGVSSTVIFYLLLVASGQNFALPRSVLIISMILVIGGVGASRLAVRTYSHYRTNQKNSCKVAGGQNILIVGAGDAGAIIAREILQSNRTGRKVAGFIDDDKVKQGMVMFGSKILGDRSRIKVVAEEYAIDEIIIAMPSVDGGIVRDVVNICRETGCNIKMVPSIYELIDGKITLDQLRNIDVEDLLRRDPVKLDQEIIKTYLQGKSVLVTGAGGSIGLEICRQVAKLAPKEIILLGRGENSIYEVDYELRSLYPTVKTHAVVADIKDEKRINKLFFEFRPQVVFHAAAHKHVPLMELQPVEAVQNNVFGTLTVAEAAQKHGAERFIMISTDKAVNPTSVMGASKRVAEMLVNSLGRSGDTIFAAVRFGNVLGSRGSVIPLFKRQIARGGPVTVTHPEMKRYFMTIPEASQLVLQAGALAQGGEVFVLDMGEPIKIADLATDLIKLSGNIPGEDIKIEYTGLRTGEKLFEELLTAEEGTTTTKHSKIFVANITPVDFEKMKQNVKDIRGLYSSRAIVAAFEKLVRTYKPNR